MTRLQAAGEQLPTSGSGKAPASIHGTAQARRPFRGSLRTPPFADEFAHQQRVFRSHPSGVARRGYQSLADSPASRTSGKRDEVCFRCRQPFRVGIDHATGNAQEACHVGSISDQPCLHCPHGDAEAHADGPVGKVAPYASRGTIIVIEVAQGEPCRMPRGPIERLQPRLECGDALEIERGCLQGRDIQHLPHYGLVERSLDEAWYRGQVHFRNRKRTDECLSAPQRRAGNGAHPGYWTSLRHSVPRRSSAAKIDLRFFSG